jgi:ketosteroid isomerase-like protein
MHIKKTWLLFAAFFCCTSALLAQIQVDAEKERPLIERRLDEYSKYLLDGDSVSLAAMYAQSAVIGCKKGPEILAAMGAWVRSGIKNNSRHVVFKTSSLTADGELLLEIGTAEGRSDKGELKYSFRYLVVWKKENGTWKLYRDVAL